MNTINQMITSSDFQKQLYKYMDEVSSSREPKFIMRRSKPEAVLLDLETYQDMLAILDQLEDRVRYEEAVQTLTGQKGVALSTVKEQITSSRK
ncbi:hypothetical protein AUK40_02490 [Candidatus Wirthbacteria bacterium CG2_30_54_11]|uniref:Antitoxin n=1 Tax=Candidatus Wirthbacteria bacterium CG2_30_54_11 TaxID=1817892 RepID=A0A1J5IX94_9BACT|nr:MAG: hypothetical protein AUK40_02490 [Candidatus Wirthbacteria bacterium CG2_30_54_11]